MNIGIDTRLLSTPIRGIASYTSNLIKFLPQYDRNNEYFIFQYEDITQENNFYNYVTIKKNSLPRQLFEHYWLNFILPKLIKKHKIDIFFTPYIFVPFYKGNWKNVTVVADALTKTCRQYYSFHYRKYMDILVPPSLNRSDAIITISESAKRDIVNHYRIDPGRIEVNYLWADNKFRPLNLSEDKKMMIMKKFNLPEKYILFVSVLEERKNLKAIIKVSDILESKRLDLKFVLVGREGFGFNKIAPELQKRKNRIMHLKGINSEDLVLIYNLATIFFFPTHYEGFGLPVLEAMQCGIPVITSDNSSLSEVVGNNGLLGDSNDYAFFVNCIEKLIGDNDFYNKMRTISIQQSLKFTPEAHFKKLLNIMNNLS